MKKKSCLITLSLLVLLSMSIKGENPTFSMTSISHKLDNQIFNNLRGMVFSVDLSIDNYKNHEVGVIGVIWYKNSSNEWVELPHANNGANEYHGPSGNVRARGKTTITNAYDHGTLRNFNIFVPYAEMVHPKGSVDYKIGFYVYDKDKPSTFLKTTSGSYYHYYEFSLVWPSENTKNNASYSSSSSSSQSSHSHAGKTHRENLPTGGYVEYTHLDDGRLMMKTVMPCTLCHGSSVCTSCWGQGGRLGPAYGGTWYPCVMCGGTGRNCCRVCNGKGEIVTIAFADGNGNAYGISSNGSTSQSNAAGTIVTTPYGTSVYPSGGSSSSSSHSSSSSSSNDYIEKIVYAPQYTGDAADVWCDKCQKWGPRHSHIKERVH